MTTQDRETLKAEAAAIAERIAEVKKGKHTPADLKALERQFGQRLEHIRLRLQEHPEPGAPPAG